MKTPQDIWLSIKSHVQPPSNQDAFSPFESILNLLKFLGLWITRKSSWKYILVSMAARLLLIDAISVMQSIYLLQTSNIAEIVTVVSVLASFVSAIYELFVLYYNTENIMSLIEEIRECASDFDVGERFIKRVLVIRTTLKGFLTFTVFTLFSSFSSCLVFHKSPYLMWRPLDIQNPVNFWLMFVYQKLGVWYVSPVVVALQLLPAHFMVYIYALCEELCERLERIKKQRALNADGSINQARRVSNRGELVKCIKLHVKIHQINKRVNDMFGIVFLVRAILNCLLICTATFSVFAISDIAVITQFTAYMIYIFIQLLTPCYFGNKIIEVSSRISSSVGHSEWMLEDKEYRQLVRIMLEVSKRPLKISSFGMFDVNLESYGRVCKSAYSLFAVCKHLYDN